MIGPSQTCTVQRTRQKNWDKPLAIYVRPRNRLLEGVHQVLDDQDHLAFAMQKAQFLGTPVNEFVRIPFRFTLGAEDVILLRNTVDHRAIRGIVEKLFGILCNPASRMRSKYEPGPRSRIAFHSSIQKRTR